jgi:hypothetical protein
MIKLSREKRERFRRDLHSRSRKESEEEEKRPRVSDKKKQF